MPGCEGRSDSIAIEKERIEVPFPAGGELIVRNFDGAIRIYGGNEPTLTVEAEKHAFTQERARSIPVKFSNANGRAVIETVPPPRRSWWSFADRSGTVHYTIIVPQRTSLPELTLVQGDFHVVGIYGSVIRARITDGRAILQNCFAELDIEVQFGRIDLLYSWWEPAGMTLRGTNHHGVVRAALPPNASFSVDAFAPGGRVRNVFAPTGEERVTPRRLHFERGEPPQAKLQLRSGTADVLIERSY